MLVNIGHYETCGEEFLLSRKLFRGYYYDTRGLQIYPAICGSACKRPLGEC